MDGIAAIEARVAEICRRFTPPAAPTAASAIAGPDFAAHLRSAMSTAGSAGSAALGLPSAGLGGMGIGAGTSAFSLSPSAFSGIGTTRQSLPARSGGIDSWIAEAIRVTGVPESWAPGLRTIAEKESSLNPAAANLTAAGGNPAKAPTGLMQTLPSTFAAHAAPGHGNILDPVDNLVAAIRYIKGRYGDPANTPGLRALARGERYVGY